jgi:hypothetical protein
LDLRLLAWLAASVLLLEVGIEGAFWVIPRAEIVDLATDLLGSYARGMSVEWDVLI